MMIKILVSLLLFLSVGVFAADDEETLTNLLALPTNQTVITEEGAFEPDASGSYSIRLYDADPGNPDNFIYRSGIIRPRAGMLEKVQVTDINNDQAMEIIVLIRATDTSEPVTADIFSFNNSELKFLYSVENLNDETDPIEQIRKSN